MGNAGLISAKYYPTPANFNGLYEMPFKLEGREHSPTKSDLSSFP
ncbi:hypothetical protein NEICINOT_03828 [Neisseria cinerea ATCC 14685]|uniref:Uncharacterized protein n=1 Tax=Neisseria cinerea ATCC 14685 TaxID=546262 RepID=D0W2E5_NEICI|nr:hypothetical protein NEICINOT_03828 [Neisseria cinerea ATCC 14685]